MGLLFKYKYKFVQKSENKINVTMPLNFDSNRDRSNVPKLKLKTILEVSKNLKENDYPNVKNRGAYVWNNGNNKSENINSMSNSYTDRFMMNKNQTFVENKHKNC